MRPILRAAVLLMAAALPCAAQVSTWRIDPAHSAAQFSVRHMMIATVRGEFHNLAGTLQLDEKDITKSSIDVTIDATTVDTREPQRDAHVKSAEFLDVANYPTMTFRSKSISAAGDGRLKVTGDLTLRGVTKEVVLDVDGPTPAIKAGNSTRRGGGNQNQPQGLRRELVAHAGWWWSGCERRGEHRVGRRVRAENSVGQERRKQHYASPNGKEGEVSRTAGTAVESGGLLAPARGEGKAGQPAGGGAVGTVSRSRTLGRKRRESRALPVSRGDSL